MALGLLSLADDEGYFLAEPALIRSALFPFTEDSLNIHGVLTELSNAEFIALREHPSHGKIGCVINFSKHQVVNRPSGSKIKAYWDSGKAHGVLTESSLPEQGTGNREGKGTGKGNIAPAPPPRDLVFEALVAFEGSTLTDLTQSARGRINAARKELKAVQNGTTDSDFAAEIAKRGRHLREAMPTANHTAKSLTAHWGEMATAPPSRANPRQTRALTAEEHRLGFFHGTDFDPNLPQNKETA